MRKDENTINEVVPRLPASNTWFVLGNSYSLNETDLSNLPDSTIGVNRILRTLWVPYILVVDYQVLDGSPEDEPELPRLREYNGRLLLHHGLTDRFRERRRTVPVFLKLPEYISRKNSYLAEAKNTGLIALEIAARAIAYHSKGGTICLLGMDFFKKYGEERSHSFGDGKKAGTGDHRWKDDIRNLQKDAKILAGKGIEVVNGSPWRLGPLDKFMEHVVVEKGQLKRHRTE